MKILIDDKISIELIDAQHAAPIFDVVDKNRNHLRPWLPFVDRMQDMHFAEGFVKGTIQRNREGTEFAFVILESGQVIGRIGIYKIDLQNKLGEIGYWLAKEKEGNGIIFKSCIALINFCFCDLQLNRVEIKCATENLRSNAIPKKLNFTKEGTLREAEWLYGKFVDLNLYALLKKNYL
jgi:ribosomal-protein-serine acetyltransferase